MNRRRLSCAIADVGCAGLLLKIDYKLKRRGCRMVKINRWFPSTEAWSCCDALRGGLTPTDRFWLCTACGSLHARDENFAEKIRRRRILKLET